MAWGRIGVGREEREWGGRIAVRREEREWWYRVVRGCGERIRVEEENQVEYRIG